MESQNESLFSRQEFLRRTILAGVTSIISPLAGDAAINKSASRVRIGVIGCGSVSTQYLPHLSKAEHVELVSTCDIIPERARTAASKYNIRSHYPSIDDMLKGTPFDLMVNLTDMQEHGRLNKLALQAGKHVWSEKPMANSYSEGKELLDLAKSKSLRLWGAPAVVNSPQFAFMAKAINAGKLGTIASAHAHYGHLGPHWSAFFYEKGGGSMPDLAVYNMATLTGLLGPVRSVVAMLNIMTPSRKVDNRQAEIKVEAEDNAMVLMEHESGTLSHVQSGFNYFDPYGHEGIGQTKPTISMWGTKGNMHLIGYDWAPLAVEMATADHEKTERYATDAQGYVWQEGATAVAKSLATGKDTLIAAEHSLHVLEIIGAARESQETGRRIQLKSRFKWPVVS